MNLLVIAVDTGNKNIKTPHTEPFNSGLICHGAIPPAVKSDTLLFDGNYYTLTQSRIPYMYNKTTDWSYYVLTLIAIAKEMMAMGYVRPGQKQVKQDVCLAMGLPPTHIHDLASEYDKYFGRDYVLHRRRQRGGQGDCGRFRKRRKIRNISARRG